MANIALEKKIKESSVGNPHAATDGKITNYRAKGNYAYFALPGFMTLDLENVIDLKAVRILLWDCDERLYRFRLLLSEDLQNWTVVFDSLNAGSKGWHVFNFSKEIKARYVRLHGIWNSKNDWFHVVQVEAYDTQPSQLEAEPSVTKLIEWGETESENGDGQPITANIRNSIDSIRELLNILKNELKDDHPMITKIEGSLAAMKAQAEDLSALEHSMDSIRREITDPVTNQLRKGHILAYAFGIAGIVGLLVTIAGFVWTIYCSQ